MAIFLSWFSCCFSSWMVLLLLLLFFFSVGVSVYIYKSDLSCGKWGDDKQLQDKDEIWIGKVHADGVTRVPLVLGWMMCHATVYHGRYYRRYCALLSS